MPPETERPIYPTNSGKESMEWLAFHGLAPRSVGIRSSDYRMMRSCPFTWYLSRRLGLTKADRYSAALSRGSWAHLAFASLCLRKDTEKALQMYDNAIDARIQEIIKHGKSVGRNSDLIREICEREEKDARTAWAWFCAATEIVYEDSGMNLNKWMSGINIVAQEPTIRHGDRVIQPDALITFPMNPKILWIVDFKTTSVSPFDRLQACPIEFQTQHYFQTMLDLNLSDYNCESLGGVIHLAVQKPTIEFGMKDRPFTMDTSPLKSGPRKGEPRNEKIFVGDPDPAIYQQRCYEWYAGTGEYLHLEPERLTNPCVNFSYTSAQHLLEDDMVKMYNRRLAFCRKYAELEPYPENFEMGDPIQGTGSPSQYLPFMLTSPGVWPDIVHREGFVQRDRDDAIIEGETV
jgi:hypothetical protein